ncbi:uncharacterized protein GGS22DRAFT_160403 [Annulohypoxylon maeteangense]|uniref:uncharacterized protein n=1 Tax=Annulohypoxylon maeteangense TaxID=1927788 RepID=UPI002007AA26|nr:uncharacterized protein GGS22DRAFT_160403 [Annulohypoxylon maeteangense]KAI0886258.1 hypothetical protein GGS22DRAFT_160403 [Annulohypoxylon maeteangense]
MSTLSASSLSAQSSILSESITLPTQSPTSDSQSNAESDVPFPPSHPTSTSPDPSQSSCVRTSSNSAIENGGFENGLSPWSVDLIDLMSTSYDISTPGASNSCSAFHVTMARNMQTDDLRSNLRLASPLIMLPPPGVNWTVSFWTRFDTAHEDSFLELLANEAVAHRVNATTELAEWTKVEVPYNLEDGDRMLQFVFSFVLGAGAVRNEVWLDQVAVEVPATTS